MTFGSRWIGAAVCLSAASTASAADIELTCNGIFQGGSRDGRTLALSVSIIFAAKQLIVSSRELSTLLRFGL
jgi:hypothetical protein